MTGFDLLDTLGKVNDQIVEESFENPKVSKQQNGKVIGFPLKKLAVACVVVAIIVAGVAVISLQAPNSKTPNNIIAKVTESPYTEDVEKETKIPKETKTPEETKAPETTTAPTPAISPTPAVVSTVAPTATVITTPVPTAAPESVPKATVAPTKEPTFSNQLYAAATTQPEQSVANQKTITDRVYGVLVTEPPSYLAGVIQGNTSTNDSNSATNAGEELGFLSKGDTITDVVRPMGGSNLR